MEQRPKSHVGGTCSHTCESIKFSLTGSKLIIVRTTQLQKSVKTSPCWISDDQSQQMDLVHTFWVHANNARLQMRDFFTSWRFQDHWSVIPLAPVAFPCRHCCCDEIRFSKFSGVQRYWLVFSLQQKRLDGACFRGSDPLVTSGFAICTETDRARMAAGGGLSFLIVSLQKK